jgi:putative ABC transport system substrate-binding protein
LGWTDGRNLRIDLRWGAGDAERSRNYVPELVALGPDVILASGDHPVMALQQATRTVPIVFAMVADPVGAGFVESLAHPGGNTTGFTLYEYNMSGKWLELLKEIAPGVKRVAVIREAGTAAGTGQFSAVAAFSRSPNGGMIVTGSGLVSPHQPESRCPRPSVVHGINRDPSKAEP